MLRSIGGTRRPGDAMVIANNKRGTYIAAVVIVTPEHSKGEHVRVVSSGHATADEAYKAAVQEGVSHVGG